MDKREARSFLSVHRPSEDPVRRRIAEAKKQAHRRSELAQWWTEEQELDRAIGAKLAAVPVPSNCERDYLRPIPLPVARKKLATSSSAPAATVVVALAGFRFLAGPFKPAASLADYRDEMVSFISLKPTLGLETSDSPASKPTSCANQARHHN